VSLLLEGNDDIEIVIVDDGSYEKLELSQLPPSRAIKIYRIDSSKGVGHAFDMGVKRAHSDNILLMGSDIIVNEEWKEKAIYNAEQYPMSFTCTTCVNLSEQDLSWEGKKKSYGATLSVTTPDGDILQCSWLREKQKDTSYEIPALLGTCYAVKKRWYMHIGGWGHLKKNWGLNKEEGKWVGHRIWGGLEPMISLKSWFAGGSCRIDPSWETGHIFGRAAHVAKSRGSRWDMYYFNKLFIAHTLFTPEEAKHLDKQLLDNRNTNLARRTITRNKRAIELEKMYNDSIKREDHTLLEDRFGVKFGF
jgi:glycosyltransferase involved in cell wall biosynthesis